MRQLLLPARFSVLFLLGTLLPAGLVHAEVLVADTSRHHVAITTGFTGADVLLFGAVEGKGDIIVVITGPNETVVVRRKQQIAGVWANTDSMTFADVPNFHVIAASRPIGDIADAPVRTQLNIGAANLDLRPAPDSSRRPAGEIEEFRKALVRNKQAEGLYGREPSSITVLSDRLFRTLVHFPANMATGTYTATVYLFREGNPVQIVRKPIVVEKTGVGAEIYSYAHDQAPLYGIAAILVAVGAGWLAGVVFRNV